MVMKQINLLGLQCNLREKSSRRRTGPAVLGYCATEYNRAKAEFLTLHLAVTDGAHSSLCLEPAA